MATTQEPAVTVSVTPTAAVEVKRFMDQEGVAETGGGLGSTFSQTDHVLCDGTNHVSVTCNGTWSSQ